MKEEFDFESIKNKALEQLKSVSICWAKTALLLLC
jgi:hypothetical protein